MLPVPLIMVIMKLRFFSHWKDIHHCDQRSHQRRGVRPGQEFVCGDERVVPFLRPEDGEGHPTKFFAIVTRGMSKDHLYCLIHCGHKTLWMCEELPLNQLKPTLLVDEYKGLTSVPAFASLPTLLDDQTRLLENQAFPSGFGPTSLALPNVFRNESL